MNAAVTDTHLSQGYFSTPRNPLPTAVRWEFRLVHGAVRGRFRFHLPALYRNRALARDLENRLTSRPELAEARCNPLTGSVLVRLRTPQTESQVRGVLSQSLEAARNGVSGRASSRSSATGGPRGADSLSPPAWHTLPTERVPALWRTSGQRGLSGKEARDRLHTFGVNRFAQIPTASRWKIFSDQFKNLPVALLAGSAGLSVLTGGLADAVLMGGVLLVNAGLGYFTERRTQRLIHSLDGDESLKAVVIRDGKRVKLPMEEVVPGDILELRAGKYIPADARLLRAEHLSVDESPLTGESIPVRKHVDAIPTPRLPLARRRNMVYRGTSVTGGSGQAIVVATGAQTELGRIHTLVTDAESPDTPLERELRVMGSQLAAGTLGVCAGVFLLGLLRRYPALQILKTSISLGVAAIPEGLQTVATTVFAAGVLRLRGRNVLVRHLKGIESLGAVNVICLDKTGTLTQNEMTVVSVEAGGRTYTIPEGQWSVAQSVSDTREHPELLRLVMVAALCNESRVILRDGLPYLKGSPTEQALIRLAMSFGVEVSQAREVYPLLETRHRGEGRNYMWTLHGTQQGPRFYAIKGRPEEVLARCGYVDRDGRRFPLDDGERKRILESNSAMAARGQRVLGVAYAPEKGSGERKAPWVWLGLVGMSDPPRPGIRKVIEAFHRAGIRTVMITGDQAGTAAAIARELNLNGDEELRVVDSSIFDEDSLTLSQAQLEKAHVFAEVNPSQKIRIVQALQRAGRVVAMTGDGVNDAPALKQADIGISMGAGGTRTARDVGDMILKEDDLSAMLAAIERGRATYDNIRKSVHYILATNLAEVVLVSSSVFLGRSSLLNPMQLLWINMATDVFPLLALGLDPVEPGVMDRPPRPRRQSLFSWRDFKQMAGEGMGLTAASLAAGWGLPLLGIGTRATASTRSFATLTAAQLLHAFRVREKAFQLPPGARHPRNPYLYGAVGAGFGMLGLSLGAPGLRRALGNSSMGIAELAGCGLAAASHFILSAAGQRALRRRGPQSKAGLSETPAEKFSQGSEAIQSHIQEVNHGISG